jgi:superoxide dismutase
VGEISKALFGTVDDEDAQFYHDQLERFGQGTTTLTQLVKQQLVIVKSTL